MLAAKPARAADRNRGHLKMALVNIKVLYSDTADPEANKQNLASNISRHFYFVDKLAAEGAEFIGFPEASVNGYHYSANMTWLKKDGPEVRAFQDKAKEKGVYISAGLAEVDNDGKKWEAQFVVDPKGQVIAWQRKTWLTKEGAFCQASSEREVFPVKGMKMGISICADGSDFQNLKAFKDKGAQIIYGPHANSTGSTLEGWYQFRSRWGGTWDGQMVQSKSNNNGPEIEMPSGGWIKQLGVYAALHNHAATYNPEYNPPVPADQEKPERWASGAWFIGPDGATLAQIPTSTDKADCKEAVLVYNVPIPGN
jgi:hypothetical protein